MALSNYWHGDLPWFAECQSPTKWVTEERPRLVPKAQAEACFILVELFALLACKFSQMSAGLFVPVSKSGQLTLKKGQVVEVKERCWIVHWFLCTSLSKEAPCLGVLATLSMERTDDYHRAIAQLSESPKSVSN